MDIKTQISTISELRVAEELTRQGNYVFQQTNGKAPFDLVVLKNKKLLRVSVKSVLKPNKHKSYKVQLRQIRSNKKRNAIRLFNKTECDVLAVYLHDVNKVLFFDVKDIQQKNTLTIKSK